MSEEQHAADASRDLREYLRVLSRRRWTIVLTVVVTVAAAVGYSFLATPIYSATASVLVPEVQAASVLNASSSQLPQAQSQARFLTDEQNFAQSDAVRKLAQQSISSEAKASVGVTSDADILTFTATNRDRAQAAVVANAFANAYIGARRTNQISQYTQQVTALEGSISALQQQAAGLDPNSSEAKALIQSMQTLEQSVQQAQAAAQLSSSYGPSLLKAAEVPTVPTSPKKTRNGLLGLVAGLILGIALAAIAERLEDGLNSRDVAERMSGGLPILALLPVVDSWREKGSAHLALAEDPKSTVAEAYRTLRTAVQFLGVDKPIRVIGITSSVPGEGKTTITANLALSFAKTGTKVAVISGDLRRPRIHSYFGVHNSIGLTSVILGSKTLSDALCTTGEEHLELLPSGPVPPNPAELLSLDRAREIVDSLAAEFELVIIDCPPVLPVSDALLLSRLVDGLLVVGSVNLTRRKQLQRSYELLRQVHAPLLGTVLNCVPLSHESSYGYEYGYYSVGYQGDEPEPAMAAGDRLDVSSASGSNGLNRDPHEGNSAEAGDIATQLSDLDIRSSSSPVLGTDPGRDPRHTERERTTLSDDIATEPQWDYQGSKATPGPSASEYAPLTDSAASMGATDIASSSEERSNGRPTLTPTSRDRTAQYDEQRPI